MSSVVLTNCWSQTHMRAKRGWRYIGGPATYTNRQGTSLKTAWLHGSTAVQNPNLATIIWYINGRKVISEYSRTPQMVLLCVHDCVPAFPITTIVALMSYIITRLLYNSLIPIPFVISLSSCHMVADTGYPTPWGSGMQDYMMGWACRYIGDTKDAVKFLSRKYLALKFFKY